MEKDFKRASRRHHFARIKKVRSVYYGMQRDFKAQEFTTKPLLRSIGMVAHTAKLCSCTMCGNPRRRLGERTIREISDLEFMSLCLRYMCE